MAALFNAKAKAFVTGRKNLMSSIGKAMEPEQRKVVWVHCASLGEFEQGRPIIEALKNQFDIAVVLTFFSPSGYQVQKKYARADYVFYLPIDTAFNASRFINIVKPTLAIFVKYEFWYHYLHQLNSKKTPTVLVSALFQPRHPFFKWYGGLHRKMLQFFNQIFVQDTQSLQLLNSIGIGQASIAGDTRIDRTFTILKQEKVFENIAIFKGDNTLIIAGSSWQNDEELLSTTLSLLPKNYKLLLAPHVIDPSNIQRLVKMFAPYNCCLFTDGGNPTNSRVMILDSMGQLSAVYKYADVVWVGGGFTRSGIHNSIEPAVYGIPLFWGPNYNRYNEAIKLIACGAAASVDNAATLTALLTNKKALAPMGANAKNYVLSQLGATQTIVNYLSEKYLDTKA